MPNDETRGAPEPAPSRIAPTPAGTDPGVAVIDFLNTTKLDLWKRGAFLTRSGLKLTDQRTLDELNKLLDEALHAGV